MDFEQEIRTLARRAIMEEINNLGIRAALREQITEAGFTPDTIRQMLNDAIDSYCRSAIGRQDISEYARGVYDKRITDAANREVERIIGNHWSRTKAVEDALIAKVRSQTEAGYDVSITITPKTQTEG